MSDRSPATSGYLLLAGLVTAAPVYLATRSALTAAGVLDAPEGRGGAAGVFTAQDARVAEGFSLLLTGPVALASLVVLLGLLTWRDWAREGALGVFGLLGLAISVLAVNGLTADPPGRNAALGLVAGLLVLAAGLLAYSPPVRDDFERHRLAELKAEREAAAAARRARTGG